MTAVRVGSGTVDRIVGALLSLGVMLLLLMLRRRAVGRVRRERLGRGEREVLERLREIVVLVLVVGVHDGCLQRLVTGEGWRGEGEEEGEERGKENGGERRGREGDEGGWAFFARASEQRYKEERGRREKGRRRAGTE